MKNSGVALLLVAVVIGGVVYVASQKKEEKVTPSQPVLPSYVPQSLIDAYTNCYANGCSLEEFNRIQSELESLARQHPESQAMFQYFADELAKVYEAPGGTFDQTPPPTLPPWLSASQQDYNNCWWMTSDCNYDALVAQMFPIIEHYASASDIIPPSQVEDARSALRLLRDKRAAFDRSTSGITRHVAGCGCQSCQQQEEPERETGHCCESCAAGGPCESTCPAGSHMMPDGTCMIDTEMREVGQS